MHAPLNPKENLVRYYRWLRQNGLNDSHSGNASVKDGEKIWVTPSGCCADTLTPGDLVPCTTQKKAPAGASLDAPLHLEIYRRHTETGAVLHSHGPHCIALTLDGHAFVPEDFEGAFYFGKVPLLDIPYERYVERSPAAVADALDQANIAIVRGHGVYARGTNLDLAYKWTCSLEASARISFLVGQIRSS